MAGSIDCMVSLSKWHRHTMRRMLKEVLPAFLAMLLLLEDVVGMMV